MAGKDKRAASKPSTEPAPGKRAARGHDISLQKSYALAEVKAHLSAIVDHVEATGEEITVTRHGKPVAKLVPERGAGPRPLGFARGRVKFGAGWDEPLTYEDLFGE